MQIGKAFQEGVKVLRVEKIGGKECKSKVPRVNCEVQVRNHAGNEKSLITVLENRMGARRTGGGRGVSREGREGKGERRGGAWKVETAQTLKQQQVINSIIFTGCQSLLHKLSH